MSEETYLLTYLYTNPYMPNTVQVYEGYMEDIEDICKGEDLVERKPLSIYKRIANIENETEIKFI